MTYLRTQILEISRQNQQENDLSPWLSKALDDFITENVFLDERELSILSDSIVSDLRDYKDQTGVSTAVLGMSGGVDSALTAALLKQAGWRVVGVTLPIHQNPEETARGVEAIEALGLHPLHVDLTKAYEDMIGHMSDVDFGLRGESKAEKIRRGNIRARLRMITLYNLAAAEGGLVASTDNYSELAAGFWTLHGDVGDLSPIQALTKSWEVPMLAKLNGVPEKTWRAKPTDGLGVDAGDEAQFGFSYLELDIMLLSLGNLLINGLVDDLAHMGDGWTRKFILEQLGITDNDKTVDERAEMILNTLLDRMGSTWFKRMNPVNVMHALDTGRYQRLDCIDRDLFQPAVVKGA